MFASGVELQSASRAIAWSWRLSFYLSATVLFLYIYNSSRERLPTRTVVNALAAYWVVVIAGGWIGVLFPTIAFASPAEAVFPHSLLNNTYFYAHVHLQFAEVQRFLGLPGGPPADVLRLHERVGLDLRHADARMPGRPRGEPRQDLGARAQGHARRCRSSRSCSRSTAACGSAWASASPMRPCGSGRCATPAG